MIAFLFEKLNLILTHGFYSGNPEASKKFLDEKKFFDIKLFKENLIS